MSTKIAELRNFGRFLYRVRRMLEKWGKQNRKHGWRG